MPAWITPLEWPVWWRPSVGSASSRQRRAPGCRASSSRAMARPRMPPPTTAKSHSAGGGQSPDSAAAADRPSDPLTGGPSGRGRGFRALGDEVDDLAHDLVDVEVLRRVDPVDAGLAQALGVGGRDDAAGHNRGLDLLVAQAAHHLRHQLQVGAGEDREADDVDVLLQGGLGNLLGGEADALVDHLHAGVAGPQGDLLGAVGVPVESGLADQDLDPVADLLGDRVDAAADLLELLAVGGGGGAADA